MRTARSFSTASRRESIDLAPEEKMKTMILNLLKGTALLGLLLLVPAFANAQSADSKAITDLLKEAKSHAVVAEDDAATLESYTRSTMSWQTHGNRLTKMKIHANDLLSDFNQLKSMRAEGSPWQQEAIDRVDPLLKDMADHLGAMIDHFNDNKNKVNMPPYLEYAKANLELMSRTNRLISDFVDYGDARAKADNLEKTLELPTVALEKE
jgi:hypothetical protein